MDSVDSSVVQKSVVMQMCETVESLRERERDLFIATYMSGTNFGLKYLSLGIVYCGRAAVIRSLKPMLITKSKGWSSKAFN